MSLRKVYVYQKLLPCKIYDDVYQQIPSYLGVISTSKLKGRFLYLIRNGVIPKSSLLHPVTVIHLMWKDFWNRKFNPPLSFPLIQFSHVLRLKRIKTNQWHTTQQYCMCRVFETEMSSNKRARITFHFH